MNGDGRRTGVAAYLERTRYSGHDNRAHIRKTARYAIEFSLDGSTRFAGICRNLSLGGAQIEAAEPPPVGARITMFMKLEGIGEETPLFGTVRWSKPSAMGVQFDLYGVRITHALLRMLAP